jgi:hypothetical protein
MLEDTIICGKVYATISWEEMAHVWHSRLGHISNKCMVMLHEKNLFLAYAKLI